MFTYYPRQCTLHVYPGKTQDLRHQLHVAPLIIDRLRFQQPDTSPSKGFRARDFAAQATLSFSRQCDDILQPPTAIDLTFECLNEDYLTKQFPKEARERAENRQRFVNRRHPDLRHAWQLHLIILSATKLELHFAYTPSIDEPEPLLATLTLDNPMGFDEVACHAHTSCIDELFRCSAKSNPQADPTTECANTVSVEYSRTYFVTRPTEPKRVIGYQYMRNNRYSHN